MVILVTCSISPEYRSMGRDDCSCPGRTASVRVVESHIVNFIFIGILEVMVDQLIALPFAVRRYRGLRPW